MRVVVISDTHGLHDDLPPIEGDLLIHCGDFEHTSEIDHWFSELPFGRILVVPGNHDYDAAEKFAEDQPVFFNAQMLVDEVVEIEGFRFYGSPWMSELPSAAFALEHDEMEDCWDRIPVDTDVLITHVPPRGILDRARNGANWGCEYLANRVEDLGLRIHCFGHVHADYGMDDRHGITFLNAANISGGVIQNSPIVIDF